jgi:Cu(I)/Ag(I) efflux system membrane fusion protein/cobalt-zinc-cadmium efflux system membrane fusion protein
MHPNVVQDEPGLCPICKMDLTPMKPIDPGSTELELEPGVIQNTGVRLAKVERGALDRGVRTVGEVAVAEDERSVINLRYDGWVERLHVTRTGDEVRQGQALLDIYSPELVSAQDELLLALRTAGDDGPLTGSARTRLENLGMTRSQIESIAASGEALQNVTVYSPTAGHVLHKDVVEGTRVKAGADLFHIGDLTRIWVLAEVYEFDAPWVVEGQSATMELSHSPGVRYLGSVGHVYPTLDPKTRTLKVRMAFDNPDMELRPGMFATVTIRVQGREGVLKVPTEAILRSGEGSSVYVAEGEGVFRAVDVITGLVGDGETEILAGLEDQQQIVVSGQFLLDSESQLRRSTAKLLSERQQAAGGHDH